MQFRLAASQAMAQTSEKNLALLFLTRLIWLIHSFNNV